MRPSLKAFLNAFIVPLVLVVTGIIIWNALVSAPDIPTMGHLRMPINSPNPSTSQGGALQNPSEENTEPEYEYIWPAPERITDDDRRGLFYTFLIVGLNDGMNVNTTMVAAYCGITREASLISIPRDIPVHPTRNGRKLSSSYIVGAAGGRGRDGGVRQVQRDVMNVIGFIPDFYVVIDYDAFFAIIDAVGGIYIDVPMRMRWSDPLQNLEIDIQPGFQHMNSHTALHFARFRQGNPGFPSPPTGDYFRIESQQAIINAVIRELLHPASLLRIPEFISIFNDSVHSNLTMGELGWFALQLNEIRGTEALSSYTMPTIGTSGAPMWYELLDGPAAVELINRTINPFWQNIELRDLNVIR